MLFDIDRIGSGLVVTGARTEIERAAAAGAAVITAPPGTGKTTVVPPLIANILASRSGGKTVVTQPRRIAARAAARRIAHLAGTRVGEEVGFAVRGQRESGPRTSLEIVTTGILLRRLLADPGLDGVGAVILDEVHERSLEGDLLLGLISEVRELRPDLLVIAMSATLEAAEFSENLGGAPVVEVPGALHPVETSYQPFSGQRLTERGVNPQYLNHVAEVATTSQAAHGCDGLVFLPGAREVDAVVDRIRERAEPDVEVLPLHGQLPAPQQDRAIAGRSEAAAGRIVVATSVAESSLTVPGVHLVIDAGLAREVRRDSARDMQGLVTVSASRASAEQRAGRAGRLGPGWVARTYSETEFARMPVQSQPEILSADLVDAALLFAAWGAPEGTGLRLLTPPPRPALERATRALHSMGAIDEQGLITDLGRRIITLPVGARTARALLSGAELLGDVRAVARAVAAISDDHRVSSADAAELVRDLQSGRHPGAGRWRAESSRLERAAQRGGLSETGEPTRSRLAQTVGTVIALARPEWIARRVGEHSRTFLFAAGTRAAVPEGSPLAQSEWIAVHEVQRAVGNTAAGTGAIIRLAATLDAETALEIAAPLLATTRTAAVEDDGARVRAREESHLGAITLRQTAVAATPQEMIAAISSHVQAHGLQVLDWRPAARTLRGRMALLAREVGAPWPSVEDAELLSRLDEWLGLEIARLAPGETLDRLDVHAALNHLLPWPQAAELEELAPQFLEVPSGSRVRIEYGVEPDARPTVSVKLQETFGLAETPHLVRGRVPVLFHLLSPAQRPLAVTDDLASFWNGPYQQVRKEMRGRYPKHPWPSNPWTAPATARTNRRSG